jgi:hypothetical protein
MCIGHARRKVGIFLSPYGSNPYSKHPQSRFGHWQVKRESPCKNHAKLCLHNTNHETPCKNHAKTSLHNSVDTENRQNFIRCKNHAKLCLHNSSHMRPNFLRKERTKSVRLFDNFILPRYIINIINQPRNKTCYSLLSISLSSLDTDFIILSIFSNKTCPFLNLLSSYNYNPPNQGTKHDEQQ